MSRVRRVPDDVTLWRRFNDGASTTELGAEYGVSESTMRYHRNRIANAQDCWVCGDPMVGHEPSDHESKAEIPKVTRCDTCGRLI